MMLSKSKREFLRYIQAQNCGRIDIGDIDGSTRHVEQLVAEGYLSKDGHIIAITDKGNWELAR